jgi:3-hydroxybutyryl-CoA dehydratase
VLKFAELTGDFNQLHVNKEFGGQSIFKKNIAHGLLVAGFFSTIVGMYCPGKNSLYLQQSVNFRQPVFYGDWLEIKGTVVEKNESVGIVGIKMEAYKDEDLAVEGLAKVKILN